MKVKYILYSPKIYLTKKSLLTYYVLEGDFFMFESLLGFIIMILAIYGGICLVKEIIRISTYNINKKNGIYFIIAAKNQENNIEEFIRTTLFRIVYGKEESINNITLVDLKSKDNTKNIMEEIARENENVKVFSINEYKKIIEDM